MRVENFLFFEQFVVNVDDLLLDISFLSYERFY